MAVEKHVVHGSAEDKDTQTRLLVWGSVFPFTDQVIRTDVRRLQYVANNFRWLGEKQVMEVKDQNINERPLTMTKDAIDKLWWGVVVGFPLFGVILGLVTWFIRRK